jgi:hypothetical protein
LIKVLAKDGKTGMPHELLQAENVHPCPQAPQGERAAERVRVAVLDVRSLPDAVQLHAVRTSLFYVLGIVRQIAPLTPLRAEGHAFALIRLMPAAAVHIVCLGDKEPLQRGQSR